MKRKRTEKGSALVEHALVFLVFFTTIYAIMEFGRLVFFYNSLANATREGARYAMVHGSKSGAVATQDDVRARVQRWAIGLDPSALTVTTTWDPSNQPGSSVRVQSVYALTPMTMLIYRTPLQIQSRSEMVISQ